MQRISTIAPYVVSAMLLIVGMIHVLPLSGVIGGARLTALYGLQFDEANLAILMRHRAVLFGLLGVFLVFAAFSPSCQTAALIAGFVSVVSFLWLAWTVGDYNAALRRVVIADVIALAALLIALLAHAFTRAPRV